MKIIKNLIEKQYGMATRRNFVKRTMTSLKFSEHGSQ